MGLRQMRFTPHGIEDIMRRERKVVVDDDSEREIKTVFSSLHRERNSISPLNLSVSQYSQAETDSYKMATRETQSANCHAEKISRRKKMRTTFTGRQIFELEKMFEVKKYLNTSDRSSLSRLLSVSEQQVKIWFQNRRTKWKKQDNVTSEQREEGREMAAGHNDTDSTINDKNTIDTMLTVTSDTKSHQKRESKVS